jgi:hypothetical protein
MQRDLLRMARAKLRVFVLYSFADFNFQMWMRPCEMRPNQCQALFQHRDRLHTDLARSRCNRFCAPRDCARVPINAIVGTSAAVTPLCVIRRSMATSRHCPPDAAASSGESRLALMSRSSLRCGRS